MLEDKTPKRVEAVEQSGGLLDALFAVIEGGFEHSSFRRVVLLVTAGVGYGASRTGAGEAGAGEAGAAEDRTR